MNVELHESLVEETVAVAEPKPSQQLPNVTNKNQHHKVPVFMHKMTTTTTSNHDYLPGVFFAVALLMSVGLVCTTERSTAVLAVQALFYVTVVASLVAVFHGRVFLEAVVAGMTYVRNEEDFFAKISSASAAAGPVCASNESVVDINTSSQTTAAAASNGPPTESLFDSSF